MEFKSIHTRFRAYQLKTKGSSFSYWDGSRFILGEARYNEDNKKSIFHELKQCGKQSIDVLHITSWDSDHCAANDLKDILIELKPKIIEYPGYDIDKTKQNETFCYNLIIGYQKQLGFTSVKIDNVYISRLNDCERWSYTNLLYNNKKDYPEANNNSTVKLFRSGCFSVLSLGDLEKEEISKWIVQFPTIIEEVDVLLLAHHGSDNGFTTDEFLKSVKPRVALALCNWSNNYGHPSDAILARLRNNNILYNSTKQGDIIIESIDGHTVKYKVWNYISNGDKLEDVSNIIFTKRENKRIQENFIRLLGK